MSALVCCPACSRHARVSEAVCPFCASALDAAVPGVVRPVSRREITRGAIVFGAASLLGACASTESADDDHTRETTGGGDDPEGGGDAADGGDGVELERDGRRHRRDPCPADDMACMAMPYGAPPRPDAWV